MDLCSLVILADDRKDQVVEFLIFEDHGIDDVEQILKICYNVIVFFFLSLLKELNRVVIVNDLH